MVSSSCSTTISVLPRSRSCFNVASSLSLSLWCRPMLGSSRIYSTPVRPEPICVARRIRCASPPERLAAYRVSVRYSRPTSCRKCRRAFTSFKIGPAISCAAFPSFLLSLSRVKNSKLSVMVISETSWMFLSPTVTARLSLFSRLPPHSSHGLIRIYSSYSRLKESGDSRYLRFRLLIKPSNTIG